VEPPAHRLAPAKGVRLSQQDEERGLKGVLGVGVVPQHPAANAEHQFPVSGDEFVDEPH